MFARFLEIVPKMERKEEILKVVKTEILPILKKQPGFLEMLPFVPEVKSDKVVTITLWADKKDFERYEREIFPKIEQILRPFLSAPIQFKHYHLETTLCEHFEKALV
ncbi:MAG TPA: antibiotic biosynthesis monooxygenase [Terriglobales bacterium]|nr:antibiotic biosynthesis monooxygenase [Terriglobales bacterium]